MSGRTSGEHRAKPLDNHPKAAQPPPIEPAYPLSRGYKCIAITFFYLIPRKFFQPRLSKPVTNKRKTNSINHEKNPYYYFRDYIHPPYSLYIRRTGSVHRLSENRTPRPNGRTEETRVPPVLHELPGSGRAICPRDYLLRGIDREREQPGAYAGAANPNRESRI